MMRKLIPFCSAALISAFAMGAAAEYADLDNLKDQLEQTPIDEGRAAYLRGREFQRLERRREKADALAAQGAENEAATAYFNLLRQRLLFDSELDKTAWVRVLEEDEPGCAYAACPVHDGSGYLLAGTVQSPGVKQQDIALWRLDPAGRVLWRRVYGGDGPDFAKAVEQTAYGGGFIVAGRSATTGDYAGDVYVLKTDADGNEEWDAAFGGAGTDSAEVVCDMGDVHVIAGSSFLGAGGQNMLLAGIGEDGAVQWRRELGRDDYESATALAYVGRMNEAGFGVAGSLKTLQPDEAHILLLKTDAQGNECERAVIAGDVAILPGSVRAVSSGDGGYYFVAETRPAEQQESDILLVKTDAAGKERWRHILGGPQRDTPAALCWVRREECALIGTTWSYGAGGSDLFLLLFDVDGALVWARTYGTPDDEVAHSAIRTQNDGGWLIAGKTVRNGKSAVYVVKTDQFGRSWAGGAPADNDDLTPREPAAPQQTAAYTPAPPPDGFYLDTGEAAPKWDAKSWLDTTDSAEAAAEPAPSDEAKPPCSLLLFWASWLDPAEESFAIVRRLTEEYGANELRIVALTEEKSTEQLNAFAERTGIRGRFGFGSDAEKAYGVRGVPYAFLLDTEGKVFWHGHPEIGIEKAVKELMDAAQLWSQGESEAANVFPDEPEAHALYDEMIAAMRQAQTLSYTRHYRWESDGRTLGECDYTVSLKKPNYFRVETKMKNGTAGGIIIGDGGYLWIHWPNGRPRFSIEAEDLDPEALLHCYMKKPAPPGGHSIGHETSVLGAGMSMPILDPSTFHGYTDSLQPYMDGVRAIGSKQSGGEECDGIEVSIMKGQRLWYLWISKRDHLPRELKQIVRVRNDIIAHEEWSAVTVNAEMADDLFMWAPPDGWQEWRLPDPEERLLKPGDKAPDFELLSADGSRVKLSDYRGKILWFYIWRAG